MVTEFLSRMYPNDRWITRVKLGAMSESEFNEELSPEELRAIGVWRRWADAVVIKEGELHLIEVAIRSDPGDISKLLLYKMLIPVTPELRRFKHLPIVPILVYAIEDPATITLARRSGIRCIAYAPDWLPDYLRLLLPRERIGHKSGGVE